MYDNGGAIKVTQDGLLPSGFFMSAGVVEGKNKIDIYLTDSIAGDLNVLTAPKP